MEKPFITHWNNILEHFDFEQVLKVMKFLNWGWGVDEVVPTLQEIKDAAKQRCLKAYSQNTTISSGGFTASYDEDGVLELEFVIQSWNTEYAVYP